MKVIKKDDAPQFHCPLIDKSCVGVDCMSWSWSGNAVANYDYIDTGGDVPEGWIIVGKKKNKWRIREKEPKNTTGYCKLIQG